MNTFLLESGYALQLESGYALLLEGGFTSFQPWIFNSDDC